MRRRPDYTKASVTYKFIIYKMKLLVTDSRGRLRYLESLDNILYDIFGVKNTMKKINNAYDPREISGLIDNLGVNVLLQLFNSGKMYKILEDLVQINYRMNELKKDIRKQSRKDKRNKDDVKEYNYLMDLYKKSIKYIRNKFGIKNTKTSYKRKYQSLSNIVKNKGYGDWDDDDSFVSILMRDDDYYFDDDDEDDDDDFDPDTTELEDFVNMLHGKSNRRKRKSSYYDDDDDDNMSLFDDDDEDDEDYHDEYVRPRKRKSYETPSIDGELHDQLNVLTDTVADLSSAVQHLMMKDEYNAVQRKRDAALRQDLNRKLLNIDEVESRYDEQVAYGHAYNSNVNNVNATPVGKELEILTDLVGKLQSDQLKFREHQKTVAEALDYMIQKQNGMDKFITEVFGSLDEDDDDDEYDEEVDAGFTRPIVRDGNSRPKVSTRDRYYEDDEDDPNKLSLSREELIDLINATSASAAKARVNATQTTVEVEVPASSANESTPVIVEETKSVKVEDDTDELP